MSYLTIQNLSSEIWVDVGEPTSISTSAIETKLLTSGYIGKLDILINSSHFVDYDYINSGFYVSPDLIKEEQAIYKEIYLMDYYTKKSLEVFSSTNGQSTSNWVTLKEADTSITRSNPTEIAKYWRELSKQSKFNLDGLIETYKRNNSNPSSVDYLTIENSSTVNKQDRSIS